MSTDRPLRLLNLNEHLILAGVSASALEIARRLRPLGVESEFYFHQADVPAALEEYRREFAVHTPRQGLLRSIIARGRYDLLVVRVRSVHFAIPAILSAGFDGPVVLAMHQAVASDPVHPRFDEVLAVAQAGARALNNPHGRPVSVILHGIDAGRFCPPNGQLVTCNEPQGEPDTLRWPAGEGPIVLWVGRIGDWMKGFPLFVALASAAVAQGRAMRFWAVHSDTFPCADELCASFGGRLTMTRGVPFARMPEVYRAVARSQGCLLLTSATECCPNIVLEAMSSGCAVVANRVGGVPELVEHDRTGLLFEPGTPLDALLGLVDRACEPRTWQRLSEAARGAIVERFDHAAVAERYAAFYRRLADDPKCRRPLTWRQRGVRLSLPVRERLGLKKGWI